MGHLCRFQGVGEYNRELDVEVALLEGVTLEWHALAIDGHAAVRLDDATRGAPHLRQGIGHGTSESLDL